MRRTASPVRSVERAWVERLQQASASEPYAYAPPETVPGDPDRHPWDGMVGQKPTVTDFTSGVGVVAACLTAAGATVVELCAGCGLLGMAVARYCGVQSVALTEQDSRNESLAVSHGPPVVWSKLLSRIRQAGLPCR